VTKPEVTILGAGIFGLAVAWACVERGASVRIIDPDGPLSGSSGGLVGALAPHVPENWNAKKAVQFDSLIAAEGYWAGVAAAGGADPGYLRSGRLQPLADEAAVALARQRAAEAATLWQGRAAWRVVEAGAHAGWAPPSPTGLLIEDTLTARLSPRMAGRALMAALAARGVDIATEGEASGLVIEATGWRGLRALSAELGQPAGDGVKGQSASFSVPGVADLPQIFAEALHIVPHADGTVAIGSTSERDFDDPGSCDAQCEALIERARALCPALAEAPVTERWAGVRPRARSRAPMLGQHPLRPGRFIANGGFKIGFGMAPLCARLLAELVLEGRDAIPAEFRVEASLKQPVPART